MEGTHDGRATGENGGGAFMEPFMTTSLMLSVPGQQAPESSESEINERAPGRALGVNAGKLTGAGEWIRIN